jgi:hypothetical protein
MRELRQMAGLRQNEVAPELGLHPVTMCKWEGPRSDQEVPKVYSESFERLVNDVERVARIKNSRRVRLRENRIKKGTIAMAGRD